MSQKNITPWAESSPPTTEPTYRASGIVAGTQVIDDDYDWPHYRSDSTVNELIRDKNEALPDLEYDNVSNYNDDVDDYRDAIMQGNFAWNTSLQWANGVDPENYISIVDSACVMPYFIDGVSYLAIMTSSSNDNHIWIYNSKDLTPVSDSGALSSLTNALDTSGGKTYELIQGVTDGVDFYAVFKENGVGNTQYAQAFSYDSGTDTWSKKIGWPTNGRSLGTGTARAGNNLLANIINATSTKLAISCNWVDISSSASTAIRILNKSDGAILTSGAGNATIGGSTNYACGGLASDGVYIYFIFYDTSGAMSRIASCDISDATTANTTLNSSNDYAIGTGAGEVLKHLLYLGNDRLISVHITSSTSDPKIVTHLVSSTSGANVAGYDIGTGAACGQYVAAVCTDGLNVYILSQKLIAVTPTHRALAISRVPISSLQFNTNHTSTYDETMSDIVTFVGFVNSGSTTLNIDQIGSICYDGRDVWSCYLHDTDYYRPYRLPKGGPR